MTTRSSTCYNNYNYYYYYYYDYDYYYYYYYYYYMPWDPTSMPHSTVGKLLLPSGCSMSL